jgi:fructose-1-phosphate kinase PfkB-like protein
LPEEIEEFQAASGEAAREADWIILSGSLPPGTPPSLYRDLLAGVRGRAIIDARGPELLETLPLKPFLVKPNREELARTLGREIHDERGLLAAMEETRRLGARWVVVSRGAESLWALGPEGLHSFEPPVIPVTNPIGCGDCLAAGIAWALDSGRGVIEAIRLGMGAAGQNATTVLPSRLDVPTVESIAARVGLSAVQ